MELGCLQSRRRSTGQSHRQQDGCEYELRRAGWSSVRRGFSRGCFSGAPSRILLAEAAATRYESRSLDNVSSGANQMNETVQQYIQRITSYMEGKQPLTVQAATPKRLERLIKGVSTSKLRKRPAPDKWSVSEIVAHLADAEI